MNKNKKRLLRKKYEHYEVEYLTDTKYKNHFTD